MADNLCKIAHLDDTNKFISMIASDKLLTWEYLPYWRGVLIIEQPREFMKKLNQLKFKADWLSLMSSNINRSYTVD